MAGEKPDRVLVGYEPVELTDIVTDPKSIDALFRELREEREHKP
jgi:hypothetical protein